jgi:predicted RNA-binding protein with PIN domain
MVVDGYLLVNSSNLYWIICKRLGMEKFRNLVIKTMLDYIKLYNLQDEDIILLHGFIEELFCKLGMEEE